MQTYLCIYLYKYICTNIYTHTHIYCSSYDFPINDGFVTPILELNQFLVFRVFPFHKHLFSPHLKMSATNLCFCFMT